MIVCILEIVFASVNFVLHALTNLWVRLPVIRKPCITVEFIPLMLSSCVPSWRHSVHVGPLSGTFPVARVCCFQKSLHYGVSHESHQEKSKVLWEKIEHYCSVGKLICACSTMKYVCMYLRGCYF